MFWQVDLFDHTGDDYNGPNVTSGIDWFNSKSICLNGSGENVPAISGDPHIKTWSGQKYDFMEFVI